MYQHILTWYHFPGVLIETYNIMISVLPWSDSLLFIFIPLEHVSQATAILYESRRNER